MKEDKLMAKMEMLKELKRMMREEDVNDLGSKLQGKIKKVTVAAPDEKGLEKGLSLAEQILAKKKEGQEFSPESEDSEEESSEEEQEDCEECPMCGEQHPEQFKCGGIKG